MSLIKSSQFQPSKEVWCLPCVSCRTVLGSLSSRARQEQTPKPPFPGTAALPGRSCPATAGLAQSASAETQLGSHRTGRQGAPLHPSAPCAPRSLPAILSLQVFPRAPPPSFPQSLQFCSHSLLWSCPSHSCSEKQTNKQSFRKW